MTDADFLRAILANPADDGPRLVYADWLEERGDPRGEFIRAQCALEGFRSPNHGVICCEGKGPPAHAGSRKRCKCDPCILRRCAGELLEKYGVEWLPKVECLTGRTLRHVTSKGTARGLGWAAPGEKLLTVGATFRRGFVAEVTLTAGAWLGGGLCEGCYDNDDPPSHAGHGNWRRSECPNCNGTGRTPGHADALSAAVPLEVVRLTTWPTFEHRISPAAHEYRLAGRQTWHNSYDLRDRAPVDGTPIIARQLLAAEWPRIRFELPPLRADVAENAGWLDEMLEVLGTDDAH